MGISKCGHRQDGKSQALDQANLSLNSSFGPEPLWLCSCSVKWKQYLTDTYWAGNYETYLKITLLLVWVISLEIWLRLVYVCLTYQCKAQVSSPIVCIFAQDLRLMVISNFAFLLYWIISLCLFFALLFQLRKFMPLNFWRLSEILIGHKIWLPNVFNFLQFLIS